MKSIVRVAIILVVCCFVVLAPAQTNPVVQPAQWDMPGYPVIDEDLLSRNFLQPFNPADARFSPAAVLQGMVLPMQFARDIGYGLYLDEPFVTNKPMIVLVHGMNDSPLRFQSLLQRLNREPYQVARYYYPTAMKISANGEVLGKMLERILQRAPKTRFVVVAHSLGGLVSRSALTYLQAQNKASAVTDFFSVASPWGGHELAKLAVSRSPIIMPVWRDLADNGDFLRQMYAQSLPKTLRFHLLYATAGSIKALGEPNDGVLTVRCQLDERARRDAYQVIEIKAAHIPALQHMDTAKLINAALLTVALADE